MTAVAAADGCHVVVGTVGIAGIASVTELCHHVVFAFCLRQTELAFAVCHPCADLETAQRTEHHALVLGYGKCHEGALELVAVVVQHLCCLLAVLAQSLAVQDALAVGGIQRLVDQSQFYHQLATVADAKTQSVLACIELVQCLLGLGVVQECACPSLGTAQNVAVGETAAEGNHVHVLQSLASGDEVGHGNVLHVEACQPEGVCHFALAVGSLLADNGGTDAALFTTVGVGAVLAQLTCEVLAKDGLYGHVLVVLVALGSLAVEALLAVQQV